jgi:hypothetical protein
VSDSVEQRLFDVQAAAVHMQRLGATAATVKFIRGLISSGQVAHVRIGKRLYVSRQELETWIGRHERRTRKA